MSDRYADLYSTTVWLRSSPYSARWDENEMKSWICDLFHSRIPPGEFINPITIDLYSCQRPLHWCETRILFPAYEQQWIYVQQIIHTSMTHSNVIKLDWFLFAFFSFPLFLECDSAYSLQKVFSSKFVDCASDYESWLNFQNNG